MSVITGSSNLENTVEVLQVLWNSIINNNYKTITPTETRFIIILLLIILLPCNIIKEATLPWSLHCEQLSAMVRYLPHHKMKSFPLLYSQEIHSIARKPPWYEMKRSWLLHELGSIHCYKVFLDIHQVG